MIETLKKFTKVVKVPERYKINSPQGWVSIKNVMQTEPYEIWVLKLENGIELKCADKHIVYKKSDDGADIEIWVQDVKPGDLINTKHGYKKCLSVVNTKEIDNMYDVEVDTDEHQYYANDIVSHNTTCSALYILWFVCFQKDKTVAIVANKATTAKSILEEIKYAYERLPEYIKPGVIEYNAFSVTFDNGCKIIARATSADCLRGEAISLLFCLGGECKVQIKDKTTQEIKSMRLDDLYNEVGEINEKYLIDTPSGWSTFAGVVKKTPKKLYKAKFDDKTIVCTDDHTFFDESGKPIKLKEMKINKTYIDGKYYCRKFEGMEFVREDECYDIVETAQHKFYVNDLISKNCDEFAFVPHNVADAFWTANFATLSTGGRCIIVSTPNGTGNIFYELWKKAKDNEGLFVPIEVKWNEVPGRDEKWREKTEKTIGKIRFAQEYMNSFVGSTVTLIDADALINILKKVDPKIVPDENTRMWDTVVVGRKYALSVDVSGGVGSDYAVINVFDVTDHLNGNGKIKQVAIWRNNQTPPKNLTKYIYESAKYWNYGYVIIEVNPGGYGDDVVKELVNVFNYENVFFDTERGDYGVLSTRGNKPMACMTCKDLIESRIIEIYDSQTIDEFGYFEEMSPGVFKAKPGDNLFDDCVMTVVWLSYFIKSPFYEGEMYEWSKKKIVAEHSKKVNIPVPEDDDNMFEQYTDNESDPELEEAYDAFLNADAQFNDPDSWLENDELDNYKKNNKS